MRGFMAGAASDRAAAGQRARAVSTVEASPWASRASVVAVSGAMHSSSASPDASRCGKTSRRRLGQHRPPRQRGERGRADEPLGRRRQHDLHVVAGRAPAAHELTALVGGDPPQTPTRIILEVYDATAAPKPATTGWGRPGGAALRLEQRGDEERMAAQLDGPHLPLLVDRRQPQPVLVEQVAVVGRQAVGAVVALASRRIAVEGGEHRPRHRLDRPVRLDQAADQRRDDQRLGAGIRLAWSASRARPRRGRTRSARAGSRRRCPGRGSPACARPGSPAAPRRYRRRARRRAPDTVEGGQLVVGRHPVGRQPPWSSSSSSSTASIATWAGTASLRSPTTPEHRGAPRRSRPRCETSSLPSAISSRAMVRKFFDRDSISGGAKPSKLPSPSWWW